MSLFKIREFWRADNEIDDEYNSSCLKICQLNGISDLILTGSHGGILRIFQPSTEITDGSNTLSEYRISDLCIEIALHSAILQVDTGKVLSGSSLSQLIILHPMSVAVYGYTSKDGLVDHGQQNIVNLIYEHKLQHSAFNFVTGPFGGSKQRDFICVQSLDGLLSFFEQETPAFSCHLPDFLLPGPMVYCRQSDSFVTQSSTWMMQSFAYKALSEFGHKKTDNNDKIGANWSFNLSESILQLTYQTVFHTDNVDSDNVIAVLGERHLFGLTESGTLLFMKTLDYCPLCMFNYVLEGNNIFSLIVSETNTLLVYEKSTIKWSAQLSMAPVAISRASFKNIQGALTLISEQGHIQCAYLGTEPFLFSAPPLSYQPINFAKTEEELTQLYQRIANSKYRELRSASDIGETELKLNVSIETVDDRCFVHVEVTPQAMFEEINVTVHVEEPLQVEPRSQLFTNTSEKIRVKCVLSESRELALRLTALTLKCIVTTITAMGVPRVVQTSTTLPLNLFVAICAPIKDSEYKVTLNINDNPVALSTLFPEFIDENLLTVTSNSMAFRSINGPSDPVTILSAKSSQRYRLQSDSLCTLNLFLEEMSRRLRKHYASSNGFAVTANMTTAPLLTTALIDHVRLHFNARNDVKLCEAELNLLALQFRLIQKRLISKFKDKNPHSLAGMECLLDDTYEQNCVTIERLHLTKTILKQHNNNLKCLLSLAQSLIELAENKDNNSQHQNVRSLIGAALNGHVADTSVHGWEDVTDASLCYLLRTVLAKGEKDRLRAAHTTIEETKELAKLEKHLSQVLDRAGKLGSTALTEDDETKHQEDVAVVENSKTIQEPIPIGSRIAESSTRALSARKSLLRKRNPIIIEKEKLAE